ncbi:protein of unknown function DUF1800 [Emticicia oligotrophica DSM 17448]|uniref:DUF1800 domain-containing protein n=1 Tax=Emticicia oligotrophica (strain DSM 17448 / CIP 109782 / MTCC 6937 / GPTSA100-15) TaxID=929562 RepID=A0ABM5N6P7_EMTOG|nr:DUF1800 domain-containing protein [Emticicia oligotrophica]AFK05172.1 protein of unknown function DUF1800 [Emticicia oligotrophica DSM 17448]
MNLHHPTKLIQADINEYGGEWGIPQITHLLKRTMFGASPEDIAYFQKKTLSETIEELLSPQTPPEPPLNFYNTNDYKDPQGILLGETWVNAIYGDGTVNAKRRASYKYWWLMQMANQKRSIHEKMVLFWHNHFATETADVDDARFAYIHNTVLRKFALGNFKEFVKQITLDPAMLRYLNGRFNSKNAPDENYGRELQELFTVGKGPNSKYTEDDVKAAARVLTGIGINNDKKVYNLNVTNHDTSDKKFSSFYNDTIIVGQSSVGGMLTELEDLINMIFSVDEVSKYICRKIYIFFIHYEITDEIENNIIEPLSKIFKENNFEIKPVLTTIFKCQHFYDPNIFGSMIKSPLDFIIGTIREFGVNFPSPKTFLQEYYSLFGELVRQGQNLQQDIGDPPNVAGWPAYYQVPMFYEIWINSDTYPKRNQFTEMLINIGILKGTQKIQIDVVGFAKKLPVPNDPNQLINDSLQILYKIPITKELIEQLKKDILLSGQSSDYYWTDLWDAMINNPIDFESYNMVVTKLRNLYSYLMALPEFQLC